MTKLSDENRYEAAYKIIAKDAPKRFPIDFSPAPVFTVHELYSLYQAATHDYEFSKFAFEQLLHRLHDDGLVARMNYDIFRALTPMEIAEASNEHIT